MVVLWFSLVLLPCSNGIPSMNTGRLPSFAMKKSPLLRNLIVPWRRDILWEGPSCDRFTSTSSCSDLRPNVIWKHFNYKQIVSDAIYTEVRKQEHMD